MSDLIPDKYANKPITWGLYNNIIFAVNQALSKIRTADLVRVESCTCAGGLSPVGYVTVTPLVNQIDGAGNAWPHGQLSNLPYLRIQGGSNAIIIDPQAGDIGIAVFASRDISKVKTTKKQGNPGSFRQYSFSDGMYLGGILNGIPTQFIQFDASGIVLTSPNAVTINANLTVNGTVTSTGNMKAPAYNH